MNECTEESTTKNVSDGYNILERGRSLTDASCPLVMCLKLHLSPKVHIPVYRTITDQRAENTNTAVCGSSTDSVRSTFRDSGRSISCTRRQSQDHARPLELRKGVTKRRKQPQAIVRRLATRENSHQHHVLKITGKHKLHFCC